MGSNDIRYGALANGVIAGLPLTSSETRRELVAYVQERSRARDAVPEPAWPRVLTPSWSERVRVADGDGLVWYVDIDGPECGGVFVSQTVVIDLTRLDGRDVSLPVPIELVSHTVEELCVTDGGKMSDFTLDIEQARRHTQGMIAAGRLMASLLEGSRGVR